MTTIETPDSACFSRTPEAVPMDELPLGSRCRVDACDSCPVIQIKEAQHKQAVP